MVLTHGAIPTALAGLALTYATQVSLDLLASCITLSTALIVVLTHGAIPTALAGLALTYATQVSLDLLASCITLSTALIVVLSHGAIPTALAGLALTYATQVSLDLLASCITLSTDSSHSGPHSRRHSHSPGWVSSHLCHTGKSGATGVMCHSQHRQLS